MGTHDNCILSHFTLCVCAFKSALTPGNAGLVPALYLASPYSPKWFTIACFLVMKENEWLKVPQLTLYLRCV